MPYAKEIASGESLIWLENSQVLKEFEGTILRRENGEMPSPDKIKVPRNDWCPKRVIAIDGSNIIKQINNGFPSAEAGLLLISVVIINLKLLHEVPAGEIPRPSIFHNMERPITVEAALPGANIVQKAIKNDTPVNYFRRVVRDTFYSGCIDINHETLLTTLQNITKDLNPVGKCPNPKCEKHLDKERLQREESCLGCGEQLFATDILRLHEYFDDARSGMEAHGRLRSTMEIIVLLNILRFFADKYPEYLADCVFVLDGPLAIFGSPASILRPIRKELERINCIVKKSTGEDIALFGVEKSGLLYEHWEQLDWDDDKGPRSHYDNQIIITPSSDYILKNVKPNKQGNAYGSDTHFGRFVLYKTNKGEHVVLNTAMLSPESQKLTDNSPECYHRLGDILNVMDTLATHLYRDSFMPLVRAHANASIPLKRGSDILQSLFDSK